MITYKEARQILETMTAEPEDGQEARLSADELDAVLLAIDCLKSLEGMDKVNEIIDNAILYGSETIEHGAWEYEPPHDYARRFGKWQFLSGGNYKCTNCNNYALHKTNYCPECGAQMDKGGDL